ncbi:MAG: type II toxin-antitoxin system ParD family antitoxin [Chloracidobacterium sp.]|nr:type II toxin-antitoxin system ParD family antitoxin [Chloracidobacterium sp.]
MARSTIHISVPEKWLDFVEIRVSEEGFGSVSEYFRELLRQDRQRRINRINNANRPHPASLLPSPIRNVFKP